MQTRLRGSNRNAANHAAEIASAKHMDVEMWHLLAAIIAMVGEHSIASFDDARIAGHLSDNPEKLRNLGIAGVFREVIHRNIWALGDDQDMDGRLRLNVFEGESVIVLIDFVTGQFAAQNFCEYVVVIVGH